MAEPKKFTNSKTRKITIPNVHIQVKPKAYSGTNPGRNLTAKEKQVRKEASLGGFGGFGGGGFSDVSQSVNQNFFSVQLSNDFLQKPQSIREKREIVRHFYKNDEIVAQSIDLHTELPLSKVRLTSPKPRTFPKKFSSADSYARYILNFFEKMCKRIKLFQNLVMIVHHYWLDGTIVPFAEDSDVILPDDLGYDTKISEEDMVDAEGNTIKSGTPIKIKKSDFDQIATKYYLENYQGLSKLIVFPIDQIKITSFSYSQKVLLDLIPTDRDRSIVSRAETGDKSAEKMVEEIPEEVRSHIKEGTLIPLNTDPYQGSFAYLLTGRKGADDELGDSILDRCLNTLIYRDKLRQAQTQIANRAMTPRRLVWAEGISESDVDNLREQIDLALQDPDYSIVTNYEIHWEEQSSRDRLLDLSSEYEQTERKLRTGLGVTESLLSGESLFSGDRLKLEVINQRYLFLRELLQEYVEDYLFKPVAYRKGFIDTNEWGEQEVLYPKLSFTRLPLRDSQDTFDALFNLYQKGSIPIEIILDMFNIDSNEARMKIEKDMFTVNDAVFNEVFRNIYQTVGSQIAEKTDVLNQIAKYLNLNILPQPEGGEESRF